ncbi:MAG: capsule assembly Wzi family protein [Nitrospiraceae bacterium]
MTPVPIPGERLMAGRALRLLIGLVAGLIIAQAVNPTGVFASADVPLGHWSYEAIERLTALDIIDRAMVVQKPYSRKQAASYVGRAIERIRADHVNADGREAVAEPLLERLMREFRPELIDRGLLKATPQDKRGLLRGGARVTTEADAFFVGGGQTVRFRENRGGEYYANGVQNQTDVRGWLEVSDWAALMVQPKFISNRHVLGIGATNNSQNFYLREFSLKLSYWNIALEAGRGTQWWGPGYHGSLLLTNHAFPLDMIKLGSDQPFRLPWKLRELGEFKINTFLTQLEKNRDFSRAKIFGLRVSWLPASWMEIGLTRLTQFDGRGRDQSFPSIIFDAYVSEANQSEGREVNEQAMVDFRAKVPRVPYLIPFPAGIQIYGELGTEDKWSELPIPSRAAILGGIYIPQVFAGDTLDLRIEYADTDLPRQRHAELSDVWYNNGTYTSGMRYRGFPLGHHMGTDGIDFFVRSTRFLTESIQLGANFNIQERDRGRPVHEKKREAAVDLTWWFSNRMQFMFGYTYQRIENPGQIVNIAPFVESFAAGVTAKNHLIWTSMAIQF